MKKESVTTLSVIANIFLTLAKFIVGLISMSSAVLAEAIHSGMDIVTSGISYIGIRASKKPSDKEHPYGHHQSETIAGFIITVILFLSSVYIIYEALIDFYAAKAIIVSYLTLAVMGASAAVNLVMSELKMRCGKKYESMALIADANHSRMDVMTSLGVFAGLVISGYWIYTDSVVAILIGAYIMWGSLKLGRRTTDILLNMSAGEEFEERIKETIKEYKIELDGLKTQKLGSEVFAEIKVKLEPELRVEDVEKTTKELESALLKRIPSLKYVVIQVGSKETGVRQSVYKGSFRRMRWGGKGRFRSEGGIAMGPGGECVCPRCGYKISHKGGRPCVREECPKCGSRMVRKANKE